MSLSSSGFKALWLRVSGASAFVAPDMQVQMRLRHLRQRVLTLGAVDEGFGM